MSLTARHDPARPLDMARRRNMSAGNATFSARVALSCRAGLATLCCLALTACNDEPAVQVPLTPDTAKTALADMFGRNVSALIAQGRVVLGHCIPTPARYQPAPGQLSCTFALLSPGGSSESRADFIPTGSGWTARPSDTDTELPFPDPALDTSGASAPPHERPK